MSILNLDLHQLIVFHNVAVEESISMAADKLCLTQPTVSYHLKSLEKQLGSKLFYISKQRVYLTDNGKELFQHTIEIWKHLEEVNRYFVSLKEKSLRIGTVPFLQDELTLAVSRVCKQYPSVKIDVSNSLTHKTIQNVIDGELDIGIVLHSKYPTKKIRAIPVARHEQFVFVASPDLPIAQKARVEWNELEQYPVTYWQTGLALTEFIAEKMRGSSSKIQSRITFNEINLSASKIFIMAFPAIGLFHIKDVVAESRAGKLRILPLPEEIVTSVDIITADESNLTLPVFKAIADNLKQETKISYQKFAVA